MRNLRLYNTDAAFKAHEQAAGGDGLSTETIVPGVSMSKDIRKRYFNPKDKSILVLNVAVNYYLAGTETKLREPSIEKVKVLSGFEETATILPKNITGFIKVNTYENVEKEDDRYFVNADYSVNDESKYCIAIYYFTSSGTSKTICGSALTSSLSAIYLNGVKRSVASSITISNSGKNIVVFELKDTVRNLPGKAFSTYYGGIYDLEEVIIPKRIESFGTAAFAGCNKLKSISFSDNLKSFASGCFSGCTALESINIPASLEEIPYSCFRGCKSLTSITIPNSVKSIRGSAFTECTSLVSVSMSNNLEMIEGGAFYTCSSLTNVVFPQSLKYIGVSGFSRCTSLTSLTIPDSVTGLSSYAFGYCIGLRTITIGTGLTEVPYRCFLSCSTLEEINIPNNIGRIGDGCFMGCRNVRRITLGTGLVADGIYANSFSGIVLTVENFINNSTLDEVENKYWGAQIATRTSDGLYIAENKVWDADSGYLSVTVPEGVTGISSYCFSGKSVQNITLPNSLTVIPSSAFRRAYELSAVSFGNSVEEIGNYAFSECNNLKTLIIPDTVKKAGSYAFYWCSGLEQVVFGSGLTTVGEYCFGLNTSLENVDASRATGLTEFSGRSVFVSCESLQEVLLPVNFSTVSDYSFCDCTSLVTVSGGCIDTIKYGAFLNCENLEHLTVSQTKAIYVDGTPLGQNPTNYPWPFEGAGKFVSGLPVYDNVYYINNLTAFKRKAIKNSYTIKDGTEYICIGCFSGYVGSNLNYLTALTIPTSVTGIGRNCFEGSYYLYSGGTRCPIYNGVYYPSDTIAYQAVTTGSGFTSFTAKETTKVINGGCFSGCSSLGTVELNSGLTTLSENSFIRCGLTGITIPNTVEKVGDNCFYNCGKLVSVSGGSGILELGSSAFTSCSVLTGFTIPAAIVRVPTGCFGYCSSLTSITLPNTITGIGDYAFYYSGLQNLIIPDNVRVIENSAFFGSKLTAVTFGTGLKEICGRGFMDCYNLTNVVIPDNVEILDRESFGMCSGLTSFTIGSGVKEIGYGAFGKCIRLTKITSRAAVAPEIYDGTNSNQNVFYAQYADGGWISSSGTLYVPTGSDYSVWMSQNNLGRWSNGWNVVYV